MLKKIKSNLAIQIFIALVLSIVAGLLLGPFCIGLLKIPGLGYNSAQQVEGMRIVTQTALGFIAFTIGNEFRLHQLKAMGSSAIIIGILQTILSLASAMSILMELPVQRSTPRTANTTDILTEQR